LFVIAALLFASSAHAADLSGQYCYNSARNGYIRESTSCVETERIVFQRNSYGNKNYSCQIISMEKKKNEVIEILTTAKCVSFNKMRWTEVIKFFVGTGKYEGHLDFNFLVPERCARVRGEKSEGDYLSCGYDMTTWE
jgi:hypothetical protein